MAWEEVAGLWNKVDCNWRQLHIYFGLLTDYSEQFFFILTLREGFRNSDWMNRLEWQSQSSKDMLDSLFNGRFPSGTQYLDWWAHKYMNPSPQVVTDCNFTLGLETRFYYRQDIGLMRNIPLPIVGNASWPWQTQLVYGEVGDFW